MASKVPDLEGQGGAGNVRPQNSFGWIIGDTSRLIRRLADRRFERLGLTRVQWQALSFLRFSGPVSQAALADALELEAPTVVRLIDRLEASGWVERQCDPQDRRANRVSATDKAAQIMDKLESISAQLREDMLVDLSPSEREQLLALMATVKTRIMRLLEATAAP